MSDPPEFKLSDPQRIKLVRDSLASWMKNNNIELYEVRRAIAMIMRLSDEHRGQEMLERRQH